MQKTVNAQIFCSVQRDAARQFGRAVVRDGFPRQPMAGKARPFARAILNVKIEGLFVKRIAPYTGNDPNCIALILIQKNRKAHGQPVDGK